MPLTTTIFPLGLAGVMAKTAPMANRNAATVSIILNFLIAKWLGWLLEFSIFLFSATLSLGFVGEQRLDNPLLAEPHLIGQGKQTFYRESLM